MSDNSQIVPNRQTPIMQTPRLMIPQQNSPNSNQLSLQSHSMSNMPKTAESQNAFIPSSYDSFVDTNSQYNYSATQTSPSQLPTLPNSSSEYSIKTINDQQM